MDAKIILGFVGQIASGKGTACKYLQEKYSAATYRFSTMLRDVLDRLYLAQSRENMQKISQILRLNFGDDLLAKVIANDVKKEANIIIGIDGVRRFPDIKYLQEIPGFKLVYIKTDQRLRYERIIKRAENTDDVQKTFEQFQEDEKQEAEKHILEVANDADFTVVNDGVQEDLFNQLDNIINQLK